MAVKKCLSVMLFFFWYLSAPKDTSLAYVNEDVMREAKCPVLIIPSKALKED